METKFNSARVEDIQFFIGGAKRVKKSVLISVRPKWCSEIIFGKKRVEVRKNKPKLDTPFTCFIYCTKDYSLGEFYACKDEFALPCQGKVIGEFVCDKIVEFENDWYDPAFYETSTLSCVDVEELARYIDDIGYGWHISELMIYDAPKELIEFCRNGECDKCGWLEDGIRHKRVEQSKYNKHRMKKPPQSWCYVHKA